ncbi:MAG TPA: hypothetical protein VMK42_15490 [Anaeromyxobacteraceae bacterium]|nr:hypothetical protein [Anaeromyxobacteraceae bacterium]
MKTFAFALLVAAAGAGLAQAPPPAAPPPAEGQDGFQTSWPRSIDLEKGSLEIYQPQIERYQGVALSARSAVAWTPKGQEPIFGVVWLDARVLVDKDARDVAVEQVTVKKVRFPNITPENEQKAKAVLEREIPKWDLHIPLSDIQASLAETQREQRSSQGLKATPPKMLFSQEPAVLLLYDGAPIERPLDKSNLKRVVNTPMFVVLDPSTGRYYLSGGKFWYEAPAATGPFAAVPAPSPAVKAYVDQNPPPAPPAEGDAAQQAAEKSVEDPKSPPKVIVATSPSELFIFDGPPRYQPVGTSADLLYVENTQSNVLVYVPKSETYVLAAGRWFRAKSLAGPWSAVRPDQLPPGFQNVPPDSPVGDVRTFVSGTDEAQDALADSQIPQTTAVKRDQQFQVSYDGEPRFKPIEGTNMAFAVNTPASVIQDAGQYWACDQAVWYVAPTPNGPWAVSDRRPPDIDQVPPSAPVYNTKYVYVYQSTPQVVYVGYTPGYVGMYPYYGTVVYGTGFYYPPYVGPAVYYPRPCTYGFRVTYNPWTGFGFTVGYATPFYSVGIHFGGYGPYYRPGWYGPVGYRPYPPPYPGGWYRPPPGYRPPYPGYRPPPPGYGGGYRPGYPGYPGYGGGRPPPATMPAPPRNNLYARPENLARNAERPQAGGQPRPAPRPVNRPNNVYGDKAGNVYRQNDKGNWERNTKQGWQPQGGTREASSRPAPSPAGRPAGGSPAPAQRPSQPSYGSSHPSQPAGRPAPQGGGYNRAPAGLGHDAAARQRSAPPPSRGGGGGGGGGGRGGKPR